MFDAVSKKPNEKACNTIDILIGAKAEVTGRIVYSGGLRIDGKVRGDVLAAGQENSTLVLSEYAEITGNVAAPHIIVMGSVNGNVYCSERIEIHPQAKISGDVHYKLIELAPGAAINGKLTRETAEIVEGDVVANLRGVSASDSRSIKSKKQKQTAQETTTV